MKQSGSKIARSNSKPVVNAGVGEHRVATPNPDLVVLRTGASMPKGKVPIREQASGVLARVGKALSKPGTNRAGVFRSTLGKPVFAYSVYAKDPTKVVREDASGQQTVGRIVGGRFRSLAVVSTE